MATIHCPSCGKPVPVPSSNKGVLWGVGCLVAVVAGFIIIAIVGLLAAIAIPSFVRAKETAQYNTCINSLLQIEAAKEQAALEQNLPPGSGITEATLEAYLPGGFGNLFCPAGGTYTIHPIGEQAECDLHGSP